MHYKTISLALLTTLFIWGCNSTEQTETQVEEITETEDLNTGPEDTETMNEVNITYECSPGYQWIPDEMIKILSPEFSIDIFDRGEMSDWDETVYQFSSYLIKKGDEIVFENYLDGAGSFMLTTGETEYCHHLKIDDTEYFLFPRYQGTDQLPHILHVAIYQDEEFAAEDIEVMYDFYDGAITPEIVAEIQEEIEAIYAPASSDEALATYLIDLMETFDGLPPTMTVTYTSYSFGDYEHIFFETEEGKALDFGNGDNDYGEIDSNVLLYEESEYIGRKFNLSWEWKTTEFNCCEGDMDIVKADVPSITKLELL